MVPALWVTLPRAGTWAQALPGTPAAEAWRPALGDLVARPGGGAEAAASSRAGPGGGALRAGPAAPPLSADPVGLSPSKLIPTAQ